jgi:hypothetical protein
MVEIIYRTEDGKIFNTNEEAIHWENVYRKIDRMKTYFDRVFFEFSTYDDDYDGRVLYGLGDIAEHITLCFNDLKKIMED